MDGRMPTEATLRETRERIDELIHFLCPIENDGVVDDRKMAWWELDHLIDHLMTDAKQVAIRRQGKLIMASITGDTTWDKGDDHGWWPGHAEADAEEDALDALERMMDPEPQTFRDSMIEAAHQLLKDEEDE